MRIYFYCFLNVFSVIVFVSIKFYSLFTMSYYVLSALVTKYTVSLIIHICWDKSNIIFHNKPKNIYDTAASVAPLINEKKVVNGIKNCGVTNSERYQANQERL